MKKYIVISVIKYGVIDSVAVFTNTKKAELDFLSKCYVNIPDFVNFAEEDKEAILDQGYESFAKGGSVCISHTS